MKMNFHKLLIVKQILQVNTVCKYVLMLGCKGLTIALQCKSTKWQYTIMKIWNLSMLSPCMLCS